MKQKLTITVILFAAMVLPIQGATIGLVFASHATSADTATDVVYAQATPNGPRLAELSLSPNAAWYTVVGSSWINPVQSGDPDQIGFVEPANGTTFLHVQEFFVPLNYTVISATLSALFDDTADGYINGVKIFSAGRTAGVNCVIDGPGCRQSTMYQGDVTPYVHAGWNKEAFLVSQLFGSSNGADYRLAITASTSEAPEPATLLFFGSGLLVITLVGFRRKLAPATR